MLRITKRDTCTIALAMLGLVGCAGTHVATDYDHRANFGKYQTYSLQRGKVVDHDAPGTPDTLVEDRIQHAIMSELNAKGLRPAQPGKSDLIATYNASKRTKVQLESAWDGGYWGVGLDGWAWDGPGYDNVWLDEYQEGTLVIDLIDSNTKKLVWRAVAKADDEKFRTAKFIDKAVDKAMDKYPPEGAVQTKSIGAQPAVY
jgi:hypothetical protein